jgi:calcineurin-like phosphoesterase family protein
LDTSLIDRWNEARLMKLTMEQFAKQEGETYSAIRSKIYRQSLKHKDYKFDRQELYDWSLPKEWSFEWDDFMVVGDVQLPTTDYDFAMLPAMIAKKHLRKPRKLIIAGDFYNMDAWSKYPKIIPVPAWVQERDAARNLLTIYAQTFDEMWMISGNHELRILGKLDGQYDINDVLTASMPNGKVKATVLDRCTVNTSNGTYTVLHGDNYSKKALNNADEWAQKFQTHIISHHEHHSAMGLDRFDRYIIINNGGLFDQKKMSYVQLKSNTCANMSQGFTMVKNGFPYLFGKFTDWNRWL